MECGWSSFSLLSKELSSFDLSGGFLEDPTCEVVCIRLLSELTQREMSSHPGNCWLSPLVPLTNLPVVAASQEHVGIFGVVLQGDKRRRRLQDNLRLVRVFYKAGVGGEGKKKNPTRPGKKRTGPNNVTPSIVRGDLEAFL